MPSVRGRTAREEERRMKTITGRLLYWVPRILGVLITLFIGLFALDVFGQGGGLLETVLGFLIHLIPAFLVAAALTAAWRWEWIGAILFFILSLAYVAMTRGREHWTAYLTISGTLAVVGALFLANWLLRAKTRSR